MPRAARSIVDIRSLDRSHTEMALNVLAGIARSGENEGARVAACNSLLDRGWGKAATTIAGDDGGPVRVLIRHVLQEKAAGALPPTRSTNGTLALPSVLEAAVEPDESEG